MKKEFIILIAVLIFVSILFLLDIPSYKKLAFLRNEVDRHQDILEEKREILSKVNQLAKDYNSHKDEIKRIYYVLPSDQDIPNLIVQFEALALENGLILETLDFTEKAAARTVARRGAAAIDEQSLKNYNILEVSLSIGGTYEAFKGFLKALEYNVRLMDIQSISFSSSEGEVGSPIFTFDIELEVYYQ